MIRRALTPTFLIGLSLTALSLNAQGCKSQLDGKKAAKVQEAPKAAEPAKKEEAAKAPAAGQALKLMADKSSVGFVGAKVTGDHTGGFGTISGQAQLSDKKLASLKVSIKTDSVTSDAEKLTAHLKSPDFFDVAKFPQSNFESTAIKAKAGEKGATHEVQGTLDLHGVKKLITFPAKVHEGMDGHAAMDAEFKINRKDFGIVYPGRKDDLIKDEVLLKINLHFGA